MEIHVTRDDTTAKYSTLNPGDVFRFDEAEDRHVAVKTHSGHTYLVDGEDIDKPELDKNFTSPAYVVVFDAILTLTPKF